MGLGFDQAGWMADVLAKGANITTSSSSSLVEALSVAGGIAQSFGLNLEPTVATLDLLHKNGIKGSAAGTALAAMRFRRGAGWVEGARRAVRSSDYRV